MITERTNLFTITEVREDFLYKKLGLVEFAEDAYAAILCTTNCIPMLDNIVSYYQDLVEVEFYSLDSEEYDCMAEALSHRDELIADSVDFIVEYCARNNLAARKRIYKEPEYIVKDICIVVSPQVPLFYSLNDEFICLLGDERTRVMSPRGEHGEINQEVYKFLQEEVERCEHIRTSH